MSKAIILIFATLTAINSYALDDLDKGTLHAISVLENATRLSIKPIALDGAIAASLDGVTTLNGPELVALSAAAKYFQSKGYSAEQIRQLLVPSGSIDRNGGLRGFSSSGSSTITSSYGKITVTKIGLNMVFTLTRNGVQELQLEFSITVKASEIPQPNLQFVQNPSATAT